jgi:hypothetical protein
MNGFGRAFADASAISIGTGQMKSLGIDFSFKEFNGRTVNQSLFHEVRLICSVEYCTFEFMTRWGFSSHQVVLRCQVILPRQLPSRKRSRY